MTKQRKKVAIITMVYGYNYGNRLQNYALEQIIREMDISVETIRLEETKSESILCLAFRTLKAIIKRLIKKDNSYYENIREIRFSMFNRKYIHLSRDRIINDTDLLKNDAKYDSWIIGSDQVWNTSFVDVAKKINIYLASCIEPKKRIAYAASFGLPMIPAKYSSLFKKELTRFKALSVREKQGALLAEQNNTKAEIVLDPTMMLKRKQWDVLSKKARFVGKEPYLVTYFLGGCDENMNRYIKDASGGRETVCLVGGFPRDIALVSRAEFTTSPNEFVWLIAHADFILTDSFHAAVLSILYHKPFRVFDRRINGKDSGMGGRIDTLLELFHLEHCRGDIDHPSGEPAQGDWTEIERILERERERSMVFLKSALEIE